MGIDTDLPLKVIVKPIGSLRVNESTQLAKRYFNR